jgi:hypothetical protein
LQQLKNLGVLKFANLLPARTHSARKRTQRGYQLLAFTSLASNCRKGLLNQIHRHAHVNQRGFA